MKVIETIRSKERCTESGWDAYDLVLSKPLDDAFIKALRPLGSLTYLAMLKKPFFKIENNNIFIKGIKGDSFFRLAVHKDYEKYVEDVINFVNELNIDINESK